jgi:bifunctional DNase/RNase
VLRADENSILPIWIGHFEANAIKMALEGQPTDRPMTHDLTMRLLATLGAQVRQVVVNNLTESTFYAEISVAIDGRQEVVDARPSDALALAVRASVPVYVARVVLEKAGGPDDEAFWERMAERVREHDERIAQRSAAPGEEPPPAA